MFIVMLGSRRRSGWWEGSGLGLYYLIWCLKCFVVILGVGIIIIVD